MIPFVVAAALAAPPSTPSPRIGLGLGLETTLNDPFAVSPGARLSAEVVALPWLHAELCASGYPDLGRANETSLTRTLRRSEGVEPDISFPRAQARAALVVVPVTVALGDLESALGLLVGGGIIATEDAVPPARPRDPALREVHPQWSVGGVADLRGAHLGARVRLEHMLYTETVLGERHSRRPLWGGVEARLWY